MARFVKTLNDILKQQEHDDPNTVTDIAINRIQFQKIQTETKLQIESYINLTTIQIVKCDLRTLDNFPILPSIKQVMAMNNGSIQGTLHILVKLRALCYLDISSNIIKDVDQLSPLKRIKNLIVCYANNPFCRSDATTLKNKIQAFNLTVEKQPRDLTVKEKTEPQQEPQKPVIEKKLTLDVLNDPFSQSDSLNPLNRNYLQLPDINRPIRARIAGRVMAAQLRHEPEINESESSDQGLPEDYSIDDPEMYNVGENSQLLEQFDDEDDQSAPENQN